MRPDAPDQASPRDNVVFEAGLFGGALGIRRTFILHADGSKLPSDLLGLTSVRYDPASGADRGSRDQPEAPQGDRERGPPRPDRGAVVAALAHRAKRGRALGGEPAANLAGARRGFARERPLLAGGRHACRPVTGAKRPRRRADPAGIFYFWRGRAPPASERPAARGHRRDHRWKPPTAPPGFGQHGRIATRG